MITGHHRGLSKARECKEVVMKKTILAVLMAVMIATPCLAEVETAGLFSVEGTLWGICALGIFSIPPFVGIACGAGIGFYQGKMYFCTGNNCTSFDTFSSYNDMVVVSFAYDINLPEGGKLIGEDWDIFLAIMQPIGIGVFTTMGYTTGGGGWISFPPFFLGAIGIMYKINDNWTPSEVE
jgi:hypothetical protein